MHFNSTARSLKMCAFAVFAAATLGYVSVPVHGHPLSMSPNLPLLLPGSSPALPHHNILLPDHNNPPTPPINNVVHAAPLPATNPQSVLLQRNHVVIQHNNTLPHLTITPRPLVDPTEMFLGLEDSFRRKLAEQHERANKGETVITTPALSENRESEDTEVSASDTTAAASSDIQVLDAAEQLNATAAAEAESFNFTKVLNDLTQRTEKLRVRLEGVQKVYAQSGLTGVADHLASIRSSVTIPVPSETRESEDAEDLASATTMVTPSKTQGLDAADQLNATTAAVEAESFNFTNVLKELAQRTEKLRAHLHGVQKVYSQSGLTGIADHLASIGSSVTKPAPSEARESEDAEDPLSATTMATPFETQNGDAAEPQDATTATVETESFNFTKVLNDLTQRTEKLRARLQGVQKVYAQSGLTGVADHLTNIRSSV